MSEQFASCHQMILDLLTGDEEILSHAYFKEFQHSAFRESCMEFQAELEELVSQLEIPTANDSLNIQREVEVKLPRIELPHFNGDYGGWTSFKDLFCSLILNKESLSRVERLHYLKCSLKGEPANLLNSFKITDQNLDIAWKTLVERYDNKSAMLNNQFRKFVASDNISETAPSIKGLLDTTMESVQLLEGMGVKNLWHTAVVFLTVQRMPAASRALWEQDQASKKEVLLLSDLKTFLNTRFRTLEATTLKAPGSLVRKIQTHHIESRLECCICKQQHKLRNCRKFVAANQSQRFDIVKKNRLCLNCLSQGHMASKCPSATRCFKCSNLHHTMLHKEVSLPIASNTRSSFPSTSAEPFVPNSVNSLNSVASKNVLLPTVLVNIAGSTEMVQLRALLDQGSQASFVTEEAVQRSGLKKKACDAVVSGIGNSKSMRSRGLVAAHIRTLNNEEITLEAFVLTKLTNSLPTRHMKPIDHPDLRRIQLADPQYNIPGRIDMVLGADVYGKLLLDGTRFLFDGLLLQQTKLGWVISGNIEQTKGHRIQSFVVERTEREELSEQLRRFWELEEPTVKTPVKPEDQRCEHLFMETTTRDEAGRFVVRLPFKSEAIKNQLGGSRRTAELGLKSLERRFERDPSLRAEYISCMEDNIRKGYMSVVDKMEELTTSHGEDRCQAYYLPHHAVRKDSSTTKTRVVFDASRKTTTGVSLNDVLLSGPSLQNDMISVIIRWRLFIYAFVADIAKMFLQIQIHLDDRDFQRIVWRFRPEDDVKDYRLNTVTFGLTSAPYLAIRTLKQLAEDGKTTYPKAAKAIADDFYVDDVLSGGDSWEEARAKIDELVELLKSGGFHLRKWISNDASLLQTLPVEDVEFASTLNLDFDTGHKSLGIMWHPRTDNLSYRYNLPEHDSPPTKRSVLSDIARLYDPLGWISPILIKAKCLIQDMWVDGVDWDDRLPTKISQRWKEFRNDLSSVERIRIPRCLLMKDFRKIEIHGFCDASMDAYAAAIYCVSRGPMGSMVRLVMSKAKVAPIKPITIPRLELCGAVLLAKIMKQFLNSVNGYLNISRIQLWTDSKIVLSWLRGHPSKWTVFVSNRVCQIMELIPDLSWRHVPSNYNPADIASRGSVPDQLNRQELWWNGPDWLILPEDQWPINQDDEDIVEEVNPRLL